VDSLSAICRVRIAAELAGVCGKMMRTGFDGYFSSAAPTNEVAISATSANIATYQCLVLAYELMALKSYQVL
jgi:hypothetical protein